VKLARYVGNGEIAILEEPIPECPKGGLLVRTEASGLCSGELMAWYMDKKIPHVIGHEVSGEVIESQDQRFPVGCRVFPHHHAPCLKCELCLAGKTVHCEQWKRTKLVPGGMAEYFAVPAENLNDCIRTDGLRAEDAALIEPLACVMKAIRICPPGERNAVIGLGVMGLLHMIALGPNAVGYDINPQRLEWARNQGMTVKHSDDASAGSHDCTYVCPGMQGTFDLAVKMAEPQSRICMFAPLAPGQNLIVPQSIYFQEIALFQAYSCGPEDTLAARDLIESGSLRAEQVVSHKISLDELPEHYRLMQRGEILKPMVQF
jgi:L-iditol 2-dehydrogenase